MAETARAPNLRRKLEEIQRCTEPVPRNPDYNGGASLYGNGELTARGKRAVNSVLQHIEPFGNFPQFLDDVVTCYTGEQSWHQLDAKVQSGKSGNASWAMWVLTVVGGCNCIYISSNSTSQANDFEQKLKNKLNRCLEEWLSPEFTAREIEALKLKPKCFHKRSSSAKQKFEPSNARGGVTIMLNNSNTVKYIGSHLHKLYESNNTKVCIVVDEFHSLYCGSNEEHSEVIKGTGNCNSSYSSLRLFYSLMQWLDDGKIYLLSITATPEVIYETKPLIGGKSRVPTTSTRCDPFCVKGDKQYCGMIEGELKHIHINKIGEPLVRLESGGDHMPYYERLYQNDPIPSSKSGFKGVTKAEAVEQVQKIAEQEWKTVEFRGESCKVVPVVLINTDMLRDDHSEIADRLEAQGVLTASCLNGEEQRYPENILHRTNLRKAIEQGSPIVIVGKTMVREGLTIAPNEEGNDYIIEGNEGVNYLLYRITDQIVSQKVKHRSAFIQSLRLFGMTELGWEVAVHLKYPRSFLRVLKQKEKDDKELETSRELSNRNESELQRTPHSERFGFKQHKSQYSFKEVTELPADVARVDAYLVGARELGEGKFEDFWRKVLDGGGNSRGARRCANSIITSAKEICGETTKRRYEQFSWSENRRNELVAHIHQPQEQWKVNGLFIDWWNLLEGDSNELSSDIDDWVYLVFHKDAGERPTYDQNDEIVLCTEDTAGHTRYFLFHREGFTDVSYVKESSDVAKREMKADPIPVEPLTELRTGKSLNCYSLYLKAIKGSYFGKFERIRSMWNSIKGCLTSSGTTVGKQLKDLANNHTLTDEGRVEEARKVIGEVI